jgi:hypothetical protein
MFSSNQKFLISGDKDKYLKIILEVALKFDDSDPNAYYIDENNGLILCKYLDNNLENISYIPEEEVGNFEYLFNIVKLYLSSKKYSNLLHNTKNEEDCSDGSSNKGWLIGLCSDFRDYDWHKIVYIKPFWAFYHK